MPGESRRGDRGDRHNSATLDYSLQFHTFGHKDCLEGPPRAGEFKIIKSFFFKFQLTLYCQNVFYSLVVLDDFI